MSRFKELEDKYIVFNYLQEDSLEKHIKRFKTLENRNIRITDRQQKVLDYARGLNRDRDNLEVKILEKELIENTGSSINIINTMIKNGIIKRIYETREIEGYVLKTQKPDEKKILTTEQKKAYNEVKSYIEEKKYKEFLLHGITGSGKTEVYLQIIEYTLSIDRKSVV